MVGNVSDLFVPHKGALYRVESEDSHEPSFVIEIRVPQDNDTIDFLNDTPTTRELQFTNHDFKVVSRLFAILDTDNMNLVSRNVVKEFVHKRCPVFSKRDDDLLRLKLHTSRTDTTSSSIELNRCSTFDEIWTSVVTCSRCEASKSDVEATFLGVEGWLIFCRFIALSQVSEKESCHPGSHMCCNFA
jgi:hypothetical protein